MSRRILLSLPLFAVSSAALAMEYPAGEPQQCAGMDIAAVYLQPIEMTPSGVMRTAAETDVHLEADIAALESNPQGFEPGSFVPYLQVSYSLQHANHSETLEGELHPMVANDGPHYGDNVKLLGPGRYQLTLIVTPPAQAHAFGLHTDRETGVQPWFDPCELQYSFTYAGTGKKGGY